jgi:integrase/recombinase XerD
MAGKAKLLTAKEIATLTDVLGNNRDRAMFAVGIYTGLRISEIISLKYNQVFTADGGVRNILKVKRQKKKTTVYSDIPMHTKLKKALGTYRDEAKQGGKDWLFPSAESTTGHLGRAQAHNIFYAAFDAINLQDASTHSMRRTFLTNMSRAGVPIRTIQEMSGHASLSELYTYLEVDPEDKRRAIDLLKY